MPGRRWAWLVTVLLLLGMAVRVALVWDELPPRLASHFDAYGRPDGWSPKTTFFGLMAVVSGGLVGMFAALSWWLPRMNPRWINLPNKDYWLAPERREASLARMLGLMDWMTTATMALLVTIVELTIRANLADGMLRGAWWALAAYLVLMGIWTWRLYRVFALPR